MDGYQGMGKEADEQAEVWNATSFFNLPRELRWRLIHDVQKRYQTAVVEGERERRDAHDGARVQRLKQKSEDHVAAVQRRVVKYLECDSIVPCATLEFLAILASGDAKAAAANLRQQIRVRIHVFGIQAIALPAIGHGDSADDVVRLATALMEVLLRPLPHKRSPCTLSSQANTSSPNPRHCSP